MLYPAVRNGTDQRHVALTHNGGGDSQTIVNMVKYAAEHYGGDLNRTYVTGTSSGAMMTNVLVGAYPDVFKAGSVYSGVPDGCFYVSGSTATQDPRAGPTHAPTDSSPRARRSGATWCARTIPDTPGPGPGCRCAWLRSRRDQEPVRLTYMIHTAGTAHPIALCGIPTVCSQPPRSLLVRVANRSSTSPDQETLKEWSDVMGLTTKKDTANTPQSGYTQTIYGDGTATTA